MRNSRKPIRVAGDEEFGEKYHVAVALALDTLLQGVVVAPDTHRAMPFLLLFAPKRVRQIEKAAFVRKAHLEAAKSTDIYLRRWSSEARVQLQELAFRNIRSREPSLRAWVISKLGTVSMPTALVWIRNRRFDPMRNSTKKSISRLLTFTREIGLRPVLIGDHLDEWQPRADNLIEFFNDPIFRGEQSIATQLLMFDTLMKNCGVRVSIGMKSGGMDGPGLFMGLPTVSFFQRSPGRLRVLRIADTIRNFYTIPYDVTSTGVFEHHAQTELEQLKRICSMLAPV
jgi:hypothetical protein